MPTTTERPAHPPSREAVVRGAYRADIDGLRAFAVLLVVTYHIWLGRVSGGVDVFLMLSAFFLTASFVRRLEAGGRPLLGRYWSRTFARLLPAAAVTLLGTLAITAWLIPQNAWPTIWEQAWASLFYVQNWVLATSAVDYYAPRDALTSPLLHFWSLSIQGQVFLIWPLLIALVWLSVRATRLPLRGALIAVFGAVFAVSLAWSVIETASNQTFAYFDTFARLWEFAAGSLLALVMPVLRVSARVGAMLTWTGIAGLVSCGLVLDVAGGFPGYLALWPVLSTVAVVVGGAGPGRGSVPARVLASRPLTWLGGIAYALYLVHWPLLIGYFAWSGEERVGLLEGAVLVAVSILLAWVITAALERPVRTRATNPGLQSVAILVCIGLVAAPLAAWSTAVDRTARAAESAPPALHPGAESLLPGAPPTPADAPLKPAPTLLEEEWVALDARCTGEQRPAEQIVRDSCGQSTWGGRETVMVVGDSHTEQFMGALMPIAEEREWRLVSLLKGGCSLGACEQWSEAVLDHIVDVRPAAVFTVATAAETDGPGEELSPGIEPAVERLVRAGIPVIAVRDNPRFTEDPYQCLLETDLTGEDCVVPRADALAAVNPAEDLAGPGVHVVDLSDAICPDGTCPARIGNVAVYLDDNHLSGAYANTLAPFLESQLLDLIDALE
jgi:peptidoglycan/LPS O-acetylase OafA/YrhL